MQLPGELPAGSTTAVNCLLSATTYYQGYNYRDWKALEGKIGGNQRNHVAKAKVGHSSTEGKCGYHHPLL